MTDPLRNTGPSLRTRLVEKLPEIVIEAGSVVLAVLLALAVSQWNEERQETERAQGARRAILAELRANRREIEGAHAKLTDIIATLRGAIGTQSPRHELSVNLGLSLLSAAAWHATLATQASQRLDFDWLTRIAKLYELQDSFLRVQDAALDQLSTAPSESGLDGEQIAARLLPRFETLDQLAQGLAQGYADTLDESTRASSPNKP